MLQKNLEMLEKIEKEWKTENFAFYFMLQDSSLFFFLVETILISKKAGKLAVPLNKVLSKHPEARIVSALRCTKDLENVVFELTQFVQQLRNEQHWYEWLGSQEPEPVLTAKGEPRKKPGRKPKEKVAKVKKQRGRPRKHPVIV